MRKIKNAEVKTEVHPVGSEEILLPTKCFICDCSLQITCLDDSDKLENNLDVIFVLKMVLQVPNIYLENQYRDFGKDPGNWIRFCDHCDRLSGTVRKLGEDIRKIEKPLGSI